MPTPLDVLLSAPSLHILPEDELRASERLWVSRELPSEVEVWGPGEHPGGIFLVELGELEIEVDGAAIGVVEAGEILSEAGTFLGEGTTIMTVRTRSEARVLLLPASALRSLRLTSPALYDGLLELCLYAHAGFLAAARAEVGRRSAELHRGVTQATRAMIPVLAPRPSVDGRPSVGALLRHLPGLRHASPSTLAAIGACFEPQSVAANEVIFREGDSRSSAWILADGEVDLYRDIPGGTERLARVSQGLLGAAALVDAGLRTATCVAVRPGWLYRADPIALALLAGEAYLAWRECLLAGLSRQLMVAESDLRSSRRDRHAREESFEELLRASGWRDTQPEGVDELQVVPTPVWARARAATWVALHR